MPANAHSDVLRVPYDGDIAEAHEAIEQAKREHPGHLGTIIAIPSGLWKELAGDHCIENKLTQSATK